LASKILNVKINTATICKRGGEVMAEDVAKRPRWNIAPYFIVDDVVTTANYYRDKLGFQHERFWGQPPCFCMVYRDGIVIMLSQLPTTGVMRPNRLAGGKVGDAWDAYIWVDNADALYDEFKSKGVKITRGICDQEYGCRDFDVEDCNGYRLCFGQDLGG
jgi:predicted enzyme related to lactoylglutathione lyase